MEQILPDLPDDVIALLATPVVVTAEALIPAPSRPIETTVAATIEECTPRFLAPAPPRRMARQHRRARFA